MADTPRQAGHEPHYDIDFSCSVNDVPFVARFSWASGVGRYVFDRFIPVDGGPALAGEAVEPASVPSHLFSLETFHCQHCRSRGMCVRCGSCHRFICGGTLVIPNNKGEAPHFMCPCGAKSEITGVIDQFDGTRHEDRV